MIRIRYLFISPGHNYFGHHEQPPGEHPIVEVDEIECVAGRGLFGDRFFDFKPDYKGQITFFAWEVMERLQRELNLADIHPGATRRNVITEGVDLNTLIGKEFDLQGVRFAGTGECHPCYWMNRAFGNEHAERWLQGNGGLRARILTDGVLRRDRVGEASCLPSDLPTTGDNAPATQAVRPAVATGKSKPGSGRECSPETTGSSMTGETPVLHSAPHSNVGQASSLSSISLGTLD